jgi:hypothetical protein
MRNLIIQYFNDEETNEITSRFINEIDNSSHLGGLTNDERLFKFYLTKRKVKFPNNFQTFRNTWFGPEIKKILKKQDNRMIDSVMIRYNLNGKQVKKALHFCLNFNINLYLTAKKEYMRYAKDYGFVDMFTGIDFIYKGDNELWIPVQVKTRATEPTYLISTLGCKAYVISEKKGKQFENQALPRKTTLPH